MSLDGADRALRTQGFSSVQASGVSSATATSGSAGASGTAVGDVASGSATSAADTAATSAAAFQLPGTKLQVLPIGLGVFAGISVIALIVVGLVTYERTKYRRVRAVVAYKFGVYILSSTPF